MTNNSGMLMQFLELFQNWQEAVSLLLEEVFSILSPELFQNWQEAVSLLLEEVSHIAN
jgi:hypothetical protein